jgi:hypothetical protein
MIAAAAGVKILVATKPVDFRRGADSLAALVREALGTRTQMQEDKMLSLSVKATSKEKAYQMYRHAVLQQHSEEPD